MNDDEVRLRRIDADLQPPSDACLRYMAAEGYDPQMPVFRAIVSPGFMAKTKALRPDIANIVQLLFGPFGIVDPRPWQQVFRVAELHVGSVVLNVEAEYED
jgi:hypothetical protein